MLPPSVSGGRTGGLVVECLTLDLGGRANDEDDDCSEAAESDVWNSVTLLSIGSWKLPLVSGVGEATLDVGGGANGEDDDCSEMLRCY